MNMTNLPKGECSKCGARWSWLGEGDKWFVADKHGRSSLRVGEVDEMAQPKPLTECPECGTKLKVADERKEKPIADPRRVKPVGNREVKKL